MIIANNGTPHIIESAPDNLSDVLFYYYLKLFFAALVVSYGSQLIIYKWFTKYEPKSENT
jgi:hypothetical protein